MNCRRHSLPLARDEGQVPSINGPTSPLTATRSTTMKLAVVIPCYRAKLHVLDVLAAIPPMVDSIHVVDDACPDDTGRHVEANCNDPRVRVHYNQHNLGVGGAVLRGYQEALACGAEIIVKIDGDGQMDPALIASFVA